MRKGKILIEVNDIIGKQSGRLTVRKYFGYVYSHTKGGLKMRHYYICDCSCGRMNIVERGPLLTEIVHSCGCSRKGKRRKIPEVSHVYQDEKQQG